ncbi:MAG: glycosyltransferase family 2 protein [Nonlabens sp.]|uniref:glycosyltransferase family 2 protein n=1 Tax=Nonlabens sp. TaxID=1888209 RepID=UPI003EF4275C
MKLSLIICTYMRPEPLRRLLESVLSQTQVPDEVLIIDGSTDDDTQLMLEKITSRFEQNARSEALEDGFLSSEFKVQSLELSGEMSNPNAPSNASSSEACLQAKAGRERFIDNSNSSSNPNARSEALEDRLSSSISSSNETYPLGLGKGFDSTSIISYHKVPPEHRGLTKQRNYGIERVQEDMEIVAFLDDDTILQENYFKNLIQAFKDLPDAAGIGGIATNENRWQLKTQKQYDKNNFYQFEEYVVKESSRNVLRNKLKLASNELPGVMPKYSHGRTFSYPITGKNYPVDLIVGMSMAFRKNVVDQIKFSKYFEGYGLYEDADFSLRALRFGQNYLATSVLLEHHHDAAGRPNKYNYGKMVVRNGWYVWRLKYPDPSLKNNFKWYQITILLTTIRFLNIFTTAQRKEALTEFLGRAAGIISLWFNKPKL